MKASIDYRQNLTPISAAPTVAPILEPPDPGPSPAILRDQTINPPSGWYDNLLLHMQQKFVAAFMRQPHQDSIGSGWLSLHCRPCWLVWLLLGLGGGLAGYGMTPVQLHRQLAEGKELTLMDIRSTALYSQGHIPGAINVPAALLAEKKLPPLGKVIVYGSGLGPDSSAEAAMQLNQKPGIQAESLEGGLAAWETAGGLTTRPAGLSSEALPMITYDQLKQTNPGEIVLVDLRQAKLLALQGGPQLNAPPPAPPLTDLKTVFPGARITPSPFDRAFARQSSSGLDTVPPLLVLIDRNDGKAQEIARALQANGIKRVVILAGGEEILARSGRPGLQRSGPGQAIQLPDK